MNNSNKLIRIWLFSCSFTLGTILCSIDSYFKIIIPNGRCICLSGRFLRDLGGTGIPAGSRRTGWPGVRRWKQLGPDEDEPEDAAPWEVDIDALIAECREITAEEAAFAARAARLGLPGGTPIGEGRRGPAGRGPAGGGGGAAG